MKKIFILSFLFLSHICSYSQSYVWAKPFITSFNYVRAFSYNPTDLFTESDGNNYSTGFHNGDIPIDSIHSDPYAYPENVDSYLFKHDSSGKRLWVKSFGAKETDEIHALCGDNKGHLYTAGIHQSVSIGTRYWIMKLDTSGNVLWEKTGLPDSGIPKAICTDAESNVYVMGEYYHNFTIDDISVSMINDRYQIGKFIAKFNADGVLQYVTTLRMQNESEGFYFKSSIQADHAGNLIFAAHYFGNGFKIGDLFVPPIGTYQTAFIIKLDPQGNVIWTKTPDVSTFTFATSLAIDRNNNIYVSGNYINTLAFGDSSIHTDYVEYSGYSCFVLKMDTDGNVQFLRSLSNVPSYDANHTIQTTNVSTVDLAIDDAGFIYAGGIYSGTVNFNGITYSSDHSLSFDYQDLFIYKFDFLGNTEWVKITGSPNYDLLSNMGCDQHGGIYINGALADWTSFDSFSANGYYLAKLDNRFCTIHNNELNISGRLKFCEGDTSLLSVPYSEFSDYNWKRAEQTFSNSSSVLVSESETYTLKISIRDFCKSERSFTVEAIKYPNIGLNLEGLVCIDSSVVLTDTSSSYPENQWYYLNTLLDSGTPYIRVYKEGMYVLTATHESMCTASDSVRLLKNPVRTLDSLYTLCKGTTLLLDANNTGYEYVWSNGSNVQQINVSATDVYRVHISKGPCHINDSARVFFYDPAQVYVTNLVTDNQDGMNDVLHVVTSYQQPLRLCIYNRWDDKIYESSAYDNSWNGDHVSEGIYFYSIHDDSGCIEDQKGWVQLIK